jgi:hypothetical protein
VLGSLSINMDLYGSHIDCLSNNSLYDNNIWHGLAVTLCQSQ